MDTKKTKSMTLSLGGYEHKDVSDWNYIKRLSQLEKSAEKLFMKFYVLIW